MAAECTDTAADVEVGGAGLTRGDRLSSGVKRRGLCPADMPRTAEWGEEREEEGVDDDMRPDEARRIECEFGSVDGVILVNAKDVSNIWTPGMDEARGGEERMTLPRHCSVQAALGLEAETRSELCVDDGWVCDEWIVKPRAASAFGVMSSLSFSSSSFNVSSSFTSS